MTTVVQLRGAVRGGDPVHAAGVRGVDVQHNVVEDQVPDQDEPGGREDRQLGHRLPHQLRNRQGKINMLFCCNFCLNVYILVVKLTLGLVFCVNNKFQGFVKFGYKMQTS